MSLITKYIALLKSHGLWVDSQGLTPDMEINGKPVTDSRQIQPGDVFICIRGYLSDGHKFIGKALDIGAELIIQENEWVTPEQRQNLESIPGFRSGTSNPVTSLYPSIRVTCARKAAALLAKLYFDNPTGKMVLIGVTGTNGKTTTSMLLWQALTRLGYKTGWIGTLGYIVNHDVIPTENTTPDILELNGIFQQMVEAGCSHVVMEVSSHALALDRVYALEYDLALFTNLSRDHLDFHKDMEDYAESKFKLFDYTHANQGKSLIFTDDHYGKLIYERMSHQCSLVRSADSQQDVYSVSAHAGDCLLSDYSCSLQGSVFHLSLAKSLTSESEYLAPVAIKTNLIGYFNVLNAAMTYASLCILLPRLSYPELVTAFAGLQPVQGRLEQVPNKHGIGVYVDYAHTPDALKSVLSAVSELPHGRILVLFGAGGNRDKGKRPEMLHEALQGADAAVITDDNPRNEIPEQIILDITDQADLWSAWWIIRDRKVAIESILKLALPGDIVLLAGKGHETYQEINGIRYPFDDKLVALQYLETAAYPAETADLILPVDALLLEILLKSPFYPGSHRHLNDEAKNTMTGRHFTQISTDTRHIAPGSLFIALKGERFDGMDYVAQVLADRTCGAVVSKTLSDNGNTIYIDDTTKALGLVAKKYLLMFAAYRIALTGSTGKTTTKEIMGNIFAQAGSTLKTDANENNLIGLCKTIFRLKPEHKTAIFELGTNHFGEIAQLAGICCPQTALITNVGASHLEFLGDEEGVYFEKTAIFRRKLDFMIFPGDDKRFDEYQNTGISVGYADQCTYMISEVENAVSLDSKSPGGISFKMADTVWQTSATVPFYVKNYAFAIATALCADLPVFAIQTGLKAEIKANLRMEIQQYGSVTVIWDCYNANPESMKAAIEFWSTMEAGRPHIAILGDMLELGSNSRLYHQGIGDLLATKTYEELITVGEQARWYRKMSNLSSTELPEQSSLWENPQQGNAQFDQVELLIQSGILERISNQSVVLVKASHGIHLEKLIPYLEQVFNVTPPDILKVKE